MLVSAILWARLRIDIGIDIGTWLGGVVEITVDGASSSVHILAGPEGQQTDSRRHRILRIQLSVRATEAAFNGLNYARSDDIACLLQQQLYHFCG